MSADGISNSINHLVLFTASFGLSDHISTTERTEVHVCTGEIKEIF